MEMSLEQLFKMMVKSANANKDSEDDIEVGKVSRNIASEFARYRREADAFEKEVEIEKQRRILELEQELADKFDLKSDLIQERHDHVWDMIYAYLNIDSKHSYYLQGSTGKVFMRTNGKDKNASPFVNNDNLH